MLLEGGVDNDECDNNENVASTRESSAF